MEQMLLTTRAPRTSLMKLLDDLSEKHIIYIHAPAGFGKTMSTLLWLEHRGNLAGTKHSWFSLDNYDNKTSEFCKRFVSALVKLQPENAALLELTAHPFFNTAPVEFALHAISVFDERQDACILVIDDLHVIKNEELLSLLPDLFKRLPANCTVLLLSRTSPPDSFGEMTAKGELTVLGTEYLQFTSEEVKIFFNKNGRYISNKQADEIFTATGGWAIALRALLLSEEKSYDINLTGKYLESFFKNHVWERWEERRKKFMMLVSVVAELTPELCDRLTSDEKLLKKSSSEEMLSELVGENAFLREFGHGKYMFHDLFRDFLLHMLEESGDKASAAQYSVAGDFHFENKDYFRAAEYYLKSGNDGGVAKSLYNMYDYNSAAASIEDTLYIIHKTVSDLVVQKHPFLLEVQAWAAYAEGKLDDFENYLDKYYAAFPKIVLKNPRSTINLMMFSTVDYRKPLVPMMKTLSHIPLKGIVNIKAFTPSITNNQPFFHRSVRDFSELATDPDKGITLVEKTFNAIIGAEFAVLKECLYAGLYYEKGSLDKAHKHALTAYRNISDGCSAEIRFCAMMMLASALYADRQEEDANEILNGVNDMIKRDKVFYLEANLKAYLCRLKLADSDVNEAREWLKVHKKNFDGSISIFKTYQYVTTARAHIVAGEYMAAVLLLNKLLQFSERSHRPLDIIESRILLAIAHWKKGRGGTLTAIEYMEQAVKEAEKYGYVQVFANEGAELVNMLHRLQKRSIQKDYARGLSGTFVKTLYIAALSESKRTRGLTGGQIPKNLTFTDKQKTVMRLMCEGNIRKGIAEKMGLTPSGVKTHMELIYKKLDVMNNEEAIMKIKELGVLDEKME